MSFHPKVRQLDDPVYALAQDLVCLDNLESMRFDIIMPSKEAEKKISQASRNRDVIIKQIMDVTGCERIEAAEAVCRAIRQRIYLVEPEKG